jgi:YVTN family beta-propeller protein
MRILPEAALLAALLFTALPSHAQQGLLLALSKGDHTLAIVHPDTLKVVARAPVGPDPHEVIASSDGRLAFVSNTGGGRFHEINVIDLTSHLAVASVDSTPLFGPHGLAFAGGKLFFTAEGSKSIGRYSLAAGRVDWAMGTGQDRTHMIRVSPDERRIFVTNVDSGTVTILYIPDIPDIPEALSSSPSPPGPAPLPPKPGWTETVIPTFKGAEGFDLSPDGRQLWTVSAANGKVYIIDTIQKKLEASIDAGATGANRLEITPDGRLALISSLNTGDITVIDTASRRTVKRIKVGTGAAGILITPDGKRAFVSCTPDNFVAIIDLTTLTVTGHLDVGAHPDGLAWSKVPDSH